MWQIVWLWLCVQESQSASPGRELGQRGIMTDTSTPAHTHIPKPAVSQSVINSPKQQVLSLCLLLTANYEALQVSPADHTCNQKLIQYQSLLLLLLLLLQPLLSPRTSPTFRSVCLLSDKHSDGNVIRSASSRGSDSVHQLCCSPPAASGRAAGTTGWRQVEAWQRLTVFKKGGEECVRQQNRVQK